MRPETKHSIVLIAGTGTTALLSMVYSVYAGRALGPADYADFTTAISFVFLLSIALGPINAVVARFTAQFASRDEYGKIRTLSREISKRVALYGLAGVLVGFVAIRPLARALRFDSLTPLVMTFGMIHLTLLLNVPRGMLRGVQDFRRYNVNIVLEAAVRLVAGMILLHCVCGVVSALSAYLIALASILLFAHVQVRSVWKGHMPESVDGAAVRRFTVPMFLFALTGAGFQNIDMLIVKHYFAPTDAGHYGAAFTLSRMIGALVTPFGLLLLPVITDLYERGQRTRGAFARICGQFLLLAAGPMLLFWLWPDKIVVLLYGPDFAAAAPLLLGLAAARLVGYLITLTGLARSGMNDFRFLLICLPGIVIETLALVIWHGSLKTVVIVVFATQALTMAAIVVLMVCLMRRQRQARRGKP